jgi:hypothetical protein
MPWVAFEPATPAFERAKTVHALDRAATVIGSVSMCRRKIVSVIRVAVAASSATVVGPSVTCVALNNFVGALNIRVRFHTFTTNGFIFLFREVNSSNILVNCSGFCYFFWLSLNHLLNLTGLAHAYTSVSNAVFTGVSRKTALKSFLCLPLSLSASAFGKGLISSGLHGAVCF